MTTSNSNYFLKVQYQIPSHWRLGIQHRNFGTYSFICWILTTCLLTQMQGQLVRQTPAYQLGCTDFAFPVIKGISPQPRGLLVLISRSIKGTGWDGTASAENIWLQIKNILCNVATLFCFSILISLKLKAIKNLIWKLTIYIIFQNDLLFPFLVFNQLVSSKPEQKTF